MTNVKLLEYLWIQKLLTQLNSWSLCPPLSLATTCTLCTPWQKEYVVWSIEIRIAFNILAKEETKCKTVQYKCCLDLPVGVSQTRSLRCWQPKENCYTELNQSFKHSHLCFRSFFEGNLEPFSGHSGLLLRTNLFFCRKLTHLLAYFLQVVVYQNWEISCMEHDRSDLFKCFAGGGVLFTCGATVFSWTTGTFSSFLVFSSITISTPPMSTARLRTSSLFFVRTTKVSVLAFRVPKGEETYS